MNSCTAIFQHLSRDRQRAQDYQAYRPIELIIIDDGSTDGSPEIISTLLQETQPPSGISVQFSKRENRGARATINEGLSLARGRYITILNSDDAYAPSRLEQCIATARSHDSRFVFTYVDPIDADGLPLKTEHPWRSWYRAAQLHELDVTPSIGFVLLERNIAVSTGNLFFRRDLYEEIGPFADYRYAHDLDFILRVLEVEEPILALVSVSAAWCEYHNRTRGKGRRRGWWKFISVIWVPFWLPLHVIRLRPPLQIGPRL